MLSKGETMTGADERYIKKAVEEECCPYCGAENPYYEEISIDALEATQICTCGDCEKQWIEAYQFKETRLLD
jgi:DNA-directed RNA polymerase subunit M/transcription elongation factor TFIIS